MDWKNQRNYYKIRISDSKNDMDDPKSVECVGGLFDSLKM